MTGVHFFGKRFAYPGYMRGACSAVEQQRQVIDEIAVGFRTRIGIVLAQHL